MFEDGTRIRTYPAVAEVLQGGIYSDFPDDTHYFETPTKSYKGYKKEELLQFKDKIVAAYIKRGIRCPPHLDTAYRINFRARIIGECDSTNIANYKRDSLMHAKGT